MSDEMVVAICSNNESLLTKHNSNSFVPKERYPRGGSPYSDIHDQEEEVLKGEGRLECQQASIIEFTRPDSTNFGNVQCQGHWTGKSPIPKTDYVMYFICWVTGGHFTRGLYCINLPLCDSY
ncbi:hypothetical protein CUMW_211390 [Citrus unshiu]|uniref:Uncharacterized protein n=1 Tax=Citrus unshiu TaxID=55188 RepID=A0A2H5QAF2_CITUN|nr:hypothetical protein CUMW_211390 [Citrus unshiu]